MWTSQPTLQRLPNRMDHDFKYFTVEQAGDETTLIIVSPASLRDDAVAREMGEEIVAYYESRRPNTLIVDFSAIDVFGDILVSALLRISLRMNDDGGSVGTIGLRPQDMKWVRTLNLHGLIDFRER